MSLLGGVAPKTVYKALPEKAQIELACKTGKQYAVQSAYYLYNLLSDPAIVQQLSPSELQKCVSQSGQIQLQTRVALTLQHLYYALTSKCERFGKVFAQMAKCQELTPEEATRIKQSVRLAKQELKEALAAKEQDTFGSALQEKLQQKSPFRQKYLELFKEKQAIDAERLKVAKEMDDEWCLFYKELPEKPLAVGSVELRNQKVQLLDTQEELLQTRFNELEKEADKLNDTSWIEQRATLIGGLLLGCIG